MTDQDMMAWGALIRATPIASAGTVARERELAALRLACPNRAGPGRAAVEQTDAAHLPLFTAANEPRLF